MGYTGGDIFEAIQEAALMAQEAHTPVGRRVAVLHKRDRGLLWRFCDEGPSLARNCVLPKGRLRASGGGVIVDGGGRFLSTEGRLLFCCVDQLATDGHAGIHSITIDLQFWVDSGKATRTIPRPHPRKGVLSESLPDRMKALRGHGI